MKLTEHFTLEEMTFSSTAIRKGVDNTPSEKEKNNLIKLCTSILEPLRLKLNTQLHVDSGYRCQQVNNLIGGQKNSQHIQGSAADIISPDFTVENLFTEIIGLCKSKTLQVDQLIQEFDRWVHVSYSDVPRGEILRATKKVAADGSLYTHYEIIETIK